MAFTPSTHDKRIAAFLKERRGDMTYAEFSKTTGVSKTVLYRLEHLEQSFTFAKLEAMAKRLRVKPDEILLSKIR